MCYSGALFDQPPFDYYRELNEKYASKVSPSLDDIQKDLHRSLPEHPVYQTKVYFTLLKNIILL